jgi:hypothetical protein
MSRFHVLHPRTRFRRYRGLRVPFSCFALSDSFSAVPRALGTVLLFCVPYSISTVPTASAPVFMLCTHGHVFDSAEGVRSRFHVLRPRTCFRWYLGRRVPFSCFALSDSFSAVLRASGPVFMFCSPRLVFSDTHGVGSHFHVLRARTHFRRYRRRPLPFSCFALTNTFSAVRRASRPVYMFCAPGLLFGVSEGVGSNFHVLHP